MKKLSALLISILLLSLSLSAISVSAVKLRERKPLEIYATLDDEDGVTDYLDDEGSEDVDLDFDDEDYDDEDYDDEDYDDEDYDDEDYDDEDLDDEDFDYETDDYDDDYDYDEDEDEDLDYDLATGIFDGDLKSSGMPISAIAKGTTASENKKETKKESGTSNPNTGVEGIAIALAIATVSAGGLLITSKKRKNK